MEAVDFYEFRKWKYISNPDAQLNKKLQVVSEKPVEEPDFLYKYYNLIPYNIDALKKNYLYASSLIEINDPFDCMNLLINTQDANINYLLTFYTEFGYSEEEIKADPDLFRNKLQTELSLFLSPGYGIISMTKNYLNTQMWAHYSSAHHGFVVKFNTNSLSKKLIGPLPINYQPDWEQINLNEGLLLSFLYLTNIKSDKWKYEDEWRYIAINPGMSIPLFMEDEISVEKRKFKFPVEAIKEIILGFKFIERLNKYGGDNFYVLAITPDTKYMNEKKELLNFIVDNNVKTSRIGLKKRCTSFELDTVPVVFQRIDPYSFIMKDI